MQLKFGIYNSYGMKKEELADLLMFTSSKDKKMITLKEYVSNMKENQDKMCIRDRSMSICISST